MSGDQAMLTAITAILTFGACVCGIAYALSARSRARLKAPLEFGNLDARLERIEQSVESIAVEIERVSEAQRFSARLLAERRESVPAQLPVGEERR
ncbi:MAG TPA: hypothetical protein VJO52_14470 [Gemmatimonadaceae bacterium]|nr:hypothetical protein [Gemmatimonadaceae bacterium]